MYCAEQLSLQCCLDLLLARGRGEGDAIRNSTICSGSATSGVVMWEWGDKFLFDCTTWRFRGG